MACDCPYCPSPDHVPNFGNARFASLLESGVTVSTLHANGMTMRLDPPVLIERSGGYGIRFDPSTGQPSELVFMHPTPRTETDE